MIVLHEDSKRQAILSSKNHLLIMGGPGSGKTTIALFKAKQIVDSGILRDGQKVLFLSFARATISRVEEQAGNLITSHTKSQIEINTYHGFIWNIIRHHGYLLTEKPIKLLPPHEASKYLLGIEKGKAKDRLNYLFREKGLIHFDLFAQVCTQLFKESRAIRGIVSRMYPIVILDEFQDTNSDEWELIKLLGQACRLIALADPNQRMLEVSDFLQRKQVLADGRIYPPINHEVAIETAGPSLAALFIACLLDKGSVQQCTLEEVLRIMIDHILGRRGNNPVPKKDLDFIAGIEKYFSTKKVRGKNREALINECSKLVTAVNQTLFSGIIIDDWKLILEMIEQCQSDYLQCIANDAKYIRMLQRGSQLHSSLDGIWRKFHTYQGAVNAVSDALTQEHFAMSTKRWNGVNVMTIHKAKGKEFDEVIIYEGLFHNRIVSRPDRIDQARLNLRVAVTRAKMHTLILTPTDDPCPLL